jgi:hypothetical protein
MASIKDLASAARDRPMPLEYTGASEDGSSKARLGKHLRRKNQAWISRIVAT